MLERRATFDATRAAFRWQIPARYNIAADICDRWAEAEPDRLALIDVTDAGPAEVTFADLRDRSAALAHALAARGVAAGDRVAVLLQQGVETAVAHLAALRMGAVSVPLSTLFGADALGHRLRDSGAKAVVTNAEGADRLAALRDALPDLASVLCIDGAREGAEDSRAACAACREPFPPVDTAADDPALLIYTSGTTGAPKGALHAHRVLLGHLPGVEISHDFLPQEGDRIWTPADWAWAGGLLDVLMPALHHGVPVVARRFAKFTAEEAFALMERHGVQNAFLPPTALKMMRRMENPPRLRLRSVASGGEAVGEGLSAWGREAFGCTINEFYGQTECNMIVSACAALEPPEPGFMGRAVPGHDLAVLDGAGAPVRPGEEGEIAVRAPDPVMFLRYWNNPRATAEKFVEQGGARWLRTGDRGRRDEGGRIAFVGRDDDVIGSAGYRIGPGEVEECLLGHPAVAMAGVVGLPDEMRGQVVAAFVTLTRGHAPSDALADEIAAHVRERLAAHEYPRVVRFLEEMPMTTTGKIIRARLREIGVGE
jgi:acetyl-CoA synthetase